MHCLKFIVDNLKVKGKKETSRERLSALIVFAQVCIIVNTSCTVWDYNYIHMQCINYVILYTYNY